MTLTFQILLIIAAILLAGYVLVRRRTHSGKAWQKIGVIILTLLMVTVVIYPEITNKLAALVGIGRGADLLLYVSVVAFLFYVISSYLQKQDEKTTIHKLARKQAILEARTQIIKDNQDK